MKKQQKTASPLRKLSRTEMKNLVGGAAAPLVWVCTLDDTCYYVWKLNCLVTCADPAACQRSVACP
jgi:hypothetical protein